MADANLLKQIRELDAISLRQHERKSKPLAGLWDKFLGKDGTFQISADATGSSLPGQATVAATKCLRIIAENDFLSEVAARGLLGVVAHCAKQEDNRRPIEILEDKIHVYNDDVNWESDYADGKHLVGVVFGEWLYNTLPESAQQEFATLVPAQNDPRSEFAEVAAGVIMKNQGVLLWLRHQRKVRSELIDFVASVLSKLSREASELKHWAERNQEVRCEDAELVVQLDIPEGCSEREIISRVRELALRADAYHRAQGGAGLSVTSLEVFDDASVTEGVPNG